ncbi:MAG: 2-phospho-L-lactate transferase CofD family protein [Candidatus Odinarchaeia archaeon]
MIYSGLEPNPILDQIIKAIKPDKLNIVIDSVLDYYNPDGLKIYTSFISTLKSIIPDEFSKTGCASEILNKLKFINFQVDEQDLVFSLILSLISMKKESYHEVIEEARKKIGINIPIVPITEPELKIELTLGLGDEKIVATPLEYYKTDINAEIVDIFFQNIDEVKVSEAAKKAIIKSSGIIICQPEPLSLFTILNLPGFKNILKDFPGKIVAIALNRLDEKQTKIMKALGQSPTVFGLINMYLNYVDALILDEKNTELIVKAGAQDLGMEIIPVDLDISQKENHSKIIRKLVKVMELDKEDLNEKFISKAERIKKTISSTANSIKNGLKKIKEKF